MPDLSRCLLLKSKLIIIVGIPGVGKTTVIEKLVEYLTTLDIKSHISVFGSVMLDEAKKIGIKNLDFLTFSKSDICGSFSGILSLLKVAQVPT